MKNLTIRILGLVAVGVSALSAAQDDNAAIADIVLAIERGWETADGTPFREHFVDFDGARYIESGGQNTGLDDLIDHHVEPEGDALEGLDLTFTNLQTHVEGDMAWAIADVEVRALVRKDQREIHNRGFETFIFKRVDGVWKVLHTHSSSRPVRPEPVRAEGHNHEDDH